MTTRAMSPGLHERFEREALTYRPQLLRAEVSASAEECALARVPAEALVTAVRELRPEFQQVIYLVDVEGFSYREVAAIMDTPLGTVMSRLHRARTSLRSRLACNADPLFELPQRGERTCDRRQEVSYVQRDNGRDHYRGCDSRHRTDNCRHNGRAPSPTAAAIRP